MAVVNGVAALFAAAIFRRNPAGVIPFDTPAYTAKINPSDSFLSLSARLSKYDGGGTDVSLPLCRGRVHGYGQGDSTGVTTEGEKFKKTQRGHGIADPSLVC